MKNLLVVLPLVVVLLVLTLPIVGAGMDDDDPKLCVEGKWLLVADAPPTGVKVYLPEDARYGNAQQGDCATPGPEVPYIQIIKERGNPNTMRVWVDGKQASQPSVTAVYGAATQVKANNGKGALTFNFALK
jgi:hypothetical protein